MNRNFNSASNKPGNYQKALPSNYNKALQEYFQDLVCQSSYNVDFELEFKIKDWKFRNHGKRLSIIVNPSNEVLKYHNEGAKTL